MIQLLYVGAGGFLGAILRFILGGLVQTWGAGGRFPVGTLTVNILGCLVIGFLARAALAHDLFSSRARAFLFVGLLGSFTTFSTFGNDTFGLFREGANGLGFLYVGGHLVAGLGAVWIGHLLAAPLVR